MKTYTFCRSLEFYKPYVIARSTVLKRLCQTPMELPLDQAHVADPWLMSSGPFVQLVYRLHDLVCGPFGMPMAHWVGYDCGLVPGFCFGFGVDAKQMLPALRSGLEVSEDYEGLVPFSVGIAIPFPDRKSWHVISLGSINLVAPGAGPAGLRRLTLAYGTALMDSDEVWFASRWRSPLISIFAGLGSLEVVTAWTPGHDYPETVTFRARPSDAARERLLRGSHVDSHQVTTDLDADDSEAMRALQADIEAGIKAYVVGPGEDRGTEVRFPLRIEGSPQTFTGTTGFTDDGEVEHA